MWTRAQLKEKAKFSFKRNYWKTVLITFLVTFLIMGGGSGSTSVGNRVMDNLDGDTSINDSYSSNRDFINGLEDGLLDDYDDDYGDYDYGDDDYDPSDDSAYVDGEYYAEDAFGNSYSFHSDTDSIGFGMVVVTFVIVFIIVFLIIMAVVLALDILIINPLEVGSRRFFYKNLNEKAEIKEIAFAFDHNYKNVITTMFFRDLYTFLWTLLFIIPGIVKSYEYQMIPYILAEHPDMPREQAFAISRQMMDGNKWKAFVLDLSFIPWNLLSLITFGIVGIFYVDPYMNMTYAALYEALKYENGKPYDMYLNVQNGMNYMGNPNGTNGMYNMGNPSDTNGMNNMGV